MVESIEKGLSTAVILIGESSNGWVSIGPAANLPITAMLFVFFHRASAYKQKLLSDKLEAADAQVKRFEDTTSNPATNGDCRVQTRAA